MNNELKELKSTKDQKPLVQVALVQEERSLIRAPLVRHEVRRLLIIHHKVKRLGVKGVHGVKGIPQVHRVKRVQQHTYEKKTVE